MDIMFLCGVAWMSRSKISHTHLSPSQSQTASLHRKGRPRLSCCRCWWKPFPPPACHSRTWPCWCLSWTPQRPNHIRCYLLGAELHRCPCKMFPEAENTIRSAGRVFHSSHRSGNISFHFPSTIFFSLQGSFVCFLCQLSEPGCTPFQNCPTPKLSCLPQMLAGFHQLLCLLSFWDRVSH